MSAEYHNLEERFDSDFPSDSAGNDWKNAMRTGVIGLSLGQLAWFVLLLLPLFGPEIDTLGITTLERFVWLCSWQVFIFAFFSVPVGVTCARFSHYWFSNSTISVTLMTTALAAVVDLSVVGWIILLLYV